MKKIILTFLPLLFWSMPITAFTESITSYVVDVVIEQDADVLVTEEIQYDFENNNKHGIIRDIPLTFQQDSDFQRKTKVDSVSVLRNGSREKFATTKRKDILEIKIGDKKSQISGSQTYTIKYRVRGPIGYFEDYDELYWNAVGTEWIVPIRKVSGSIKLESGSFLDQLSCIEGSLDSERTCSTGLLGNTFSFASTRPIEAGQGVTVAVAFPKNTVEEVIYFDFWYYVYNILNFLPWLFMGIPLLIIYKVTEFLFRRHKVLNEHQVDKTVIAQYESYEDLSPIETGYLMQNNGSSIEQAITAGIISLAANEFITITNPGKAVIIGPSQ